MPSYTHPQMKCFLKALRHTFWLIVEASISPDGMSAYTLFPYERDILLPVVTPCSLSLPR